MTVSLKRERLRRYRDMARLFWRHGRSDVVKQAGTEDVFMEDLRPREGVKDAQDLARDLEAMGPTFTKLGQLLSTRPDILPPPYVKALARLQDKVEPVPTEEIVATIEAEFGKPVAVLFLEFDAEPLAAASLGQVHRAVLPDGRLVAVKVQRPHVRERIAEDLAALDDVARFLDARTKAGRRYGFRGILEEFRRTLVGELDYKREAANLQTIARNLAEIERIVVPLPVLEMTTSKVLTMDFVRGRKISRIEVLRRPECDGEVLADALFKAYLKQVLVDGFFHADPHPGNLFLTDDGRIALLDLGMVARVPPELQDRLLEWLLAISEGRGEDAAGIAIRICRVREDFDRGEFKRRVADVVARNVGEDLRGMEVGRIVLEAVRICGDSGLDTPHELTMLGKALLNLDQVGRMLDPGFDPTVAIRRHATEIARHRMAHSVTAANALEVLMEAKEFVGRLPRRLNRLMEHVANNEVEIKVDAIDEERLIQGLHKIANRITLGLVLAALIVAAALLMRVPATLTILGWPALPAVLFFVAACGGLALAASIVVHDRQKPPR